MDKEKTEQIKIALLGIIAILLIIKTINGLSGTESDVANEQTDPNKPFVNQTGGINVPANPVNIVPNQLNTQAQPGAPNQPIQPTQPTTEMIFNNTSGDLGNIKIGSEASFSYEMTNTGTIPLIFNQVTADPGVTVISSPKEPIPVGGKGTITVKVSNDIESGAFQKTIHVGSNTTPNHMHLILNGVASK